MNNKIIKITVKDSDFLNQILQKLNSIDLFEDEAEKKIMKVGFMINEYYDKGLLSEKESEHLWEKWSERMTEYQDFKNEDFSEIRSQNEYKQHEIVDSFNVRYHNKSKENKLVKDSTHTKVTDGHIKFTLRVTDMIKKFIEDDDKIKVDLTEIEGTLANLFRKHYDEITKNLDLYYYTKGKNPETGKYDPNYFLEKWQLVFDLLTGPEVTNASDKYISGKIRDFYRVKNNSHVSRDKINAAKQKIREAKAKYGLDSYEYKTAKNEFLLLAKNAAEAFSRLCDFVNNIVLRAEGVGVEQIGEVKESKE